MTRLPQQASHFVQRRGLRYIGVDDVKGVESLVVEGVITCVDLLTEEDTHCYDDCLVGTSRQRGGENWLTGCNDGVELVDGAHGNGAVVTVFALDFTGNDDPQLEAGGACGRFNIPLGVDTLIESDGSGGSGNVERVGCAEHRREFGFLVESEVDQVADGVVLDGAFAAGVGGVGVEVLFVLGEQAGEVIAVIRLTNEGSQGVNEPFGLITGATEFRHVLAGADELFIVHDAVFFDAAFEFDNVFAVGAQEGNVIEGAYDFNAEFLTCHVEICFCPLLSSLHYFFQRLMVGCWLKKIGLEKYISGDLYQI